MSLSKILEVVNLGDTLRDSAGNTYSLDAYNVAADTLTVTRLKDQQQRDVSVRVAWDMMVNWRLWKDEPKKKGRAKA